jgi:hypothetical protein
MSWWMGVRRRPLRVVVGAHELVDGRSRTRGWALTNWWVGAALAGPRVVVGLCHRSVMVVVVIVAKVAGLEVVMVGVV